MGLINVQSLSLVFAAVAALGLYLTLSSARITRNGVPLKKALNTLPLAGNGILFLRARQKLFSWFVKCERHFGHETFQISVPGLPPGVVINDPRNLDFVFKNEGVFVKGEFVTGKLWDLFGHGIINADGEAWKVQRKAGLHFLSTKNLAILTGEALPKYLLESVEHLRGKQGDKVDLQEVFHEITSQLMGSLAYNMELHATDDFTRAFDYASAATTERFQNPLYPITELFFGAKMRQSIATVRSFGRNLVARAQQDRQRQKTEERGLTQMTGSLIQSLLDAIGDEKMVADAALNYLSAGRDTTAQALTWTFYSLMREDPSIFARVRKEALQRKAQHYQSEVSSLDPTLFTPSTMPYTLSVLYETLRLFPPIPFEIKQTHSSPTLLPDGTLLSPGSVVLWCAWAMNRSHTTWGCDADVFRPERWLSVSSPSEAPTFTPPRSAAEFSVFNGGKRLCLGKAMAEAVAVQVIATFALAFDFEPAYAGERVSATSLTLPMEGGLPCVVRAREGATSK